jgi:hypothetical protein
MNGAIDTAAASQSTIGSVDDGVGRLLGNVSRHQFERAGTNLNVHDASAAWS